MRLFVMIILLLLTTSAYAEDVYTKIDDKNLSITITKEQVINVDTLKEEKTGLIIYRFQAIEDQKQLDIAIAEIDKILEKAEKLGVK